MQMDSFEKLYVDELRDMYNAEKQLVRAIPKMAKAANSTELRSALEDHLEVTRRQVERLEEIFQDMGRPATGKTCRGMAGILEEGQEMLEEAEDDEVQDASIIAAAQKVEHYEIASYGTLRAFAENRGDRKAAQILQEILDQEKEADQTLTRIAEQSASIRGEAANGEHFEDEGENEEEEESASPRPRAAGPVSVPKSRPGNGAAKSHRR